MGALEFQIKYNGNDTSISNLFEGVGEGSNQDTNNYQNIGNSYYSQNYKGFYYLKRNNGYHKLGVHINCPKIENYFAIKSDGEVLNLPQPLLKNTCPLKSTSSFLINLDVKTGWYINNSTLYDANDNVISSLPRVVAVELVGAGGGGGSINVYGYSGSEYLCGQGGGGGGYALIYIDTTHRTWHFSCGIGGDGGTYSGEEAGSGRYGGDTVIWNNINIASETSIGGDIDSNPAIFARGGGGGQGYTGDDINSHGINNEGSVYVHRAWSTYIQDISNPHGYLVVNYSGSKGSAPGDNLSLQGDPSIMTDSYAVSPYATFPGSKYPSNITSIPDDNVVIDVQGYAWGHGGCSRLGVGRCNKWLRVLHPQPGSEPDWIGKTVESPTNIGGGGSGGLALPTTINGTKSSKHGTRGYNGRIKIYY